jgi:hypothetical protein
LQIRVLYSLGDTLFLSAEISPTDDANLPSDIYVAVVSPDGSVYTLDKSLVWKSTFEPILASFPISQVLANNFYSLQLPFNMAPGKYDFYLVAVPVNANPTNDTAWLASSMYSVNILNKSKFPPATCLSAIAGSSQSNKAINLGCNSYLRQTINGVIKVASALYVRGIATCTVQNNNGNPIIDEHQGYCSAVSGDVSASVTPN